MVDRIEGIFYEPLSSRSVAAAVIYHDGGELEVSLPDGSRMYPAGHYTFEPPLGSLKRVIHFKDEARFETEDDVSVRRVEKLVNPESLWVAVDWLERHWRGAVGCLVLLVTGTAAFLEWGVPAIANEVSKEVPQSWRRTITDESIEFMLEVRYLEESELESEERERVEGVFERALALSAADEDAFDYQLQLYKGGIVGANAFAFPSGTVVATDEFARLCEKDEQMLAVFLHEIAHVEQQHGIRAMIQRSSIYFIFSLLLGDASQVLTFAEGLPALVLESRYSQKFELESDTFAGRQLEAGGLDATAMKDILILLHEGSPDVPMATFLSTHPSLRKRVENIDAISGTKGDLPSAPRLFHPE